MRGFVYTSCCWMIGIWTALLVASSVWFFRNLHAAAALIGVQDQHPTVITAGWIVAQIGVWAAVVIPFGIVAILSRRAWPVVEIRKRDYFEYERKIREGEPET